ncbi:hypothetical protein WK65_18320 [Burkholderia ubonensis]|uniref:hypothetical protein n=1 Tax=Burkholderia ubonensis TaxID=101571 RepID=UPI00075C6B2E|nr:hypothetical protein [Burkholderia ubonensis]KVU22294.1 hypothetical protein WK65_18320 [Burkholderia ubonensis]
MKIWTVTEEGEALAKRFEGIDRASFARSHGITGGASMIYQHLTGRRPMSTKAAIEYAAAFECPLEEISPRIALEVAEAARFLGGEVTPITEASKPLLPSKGKRLHQQAQALIDDVVSADERGVDAQVFSVLQQTLRLFERLDGQSDGILHMDDPIP